MIRVSLDVLQILFVFFPVASLILFYAGFFKVESNSVVASDRCDTPVPYASIAVCRLCNAMFLGGSVHHLFIRTGSRSACLLRSDIAR